MKTIMKVTIRILEPKNFERNIEQKKVEILEKYLWRSSVLVNNFHWVTIRTEKKG